MTDPKVIWRRAGHEDVEVDAAALLVALYERAVPQGLGILQALAVHEMTRERAVLILDEGRSGFWFDYLNGRPIKVRAKDGVIDETSQRLFDRDAGEGQFAKAIAEALAYQQP